MTRNDDDGGADVVAGVVEGVVDAIVPGGHGIVRDPNGVVFVSRALPGERVRAQVVRRQKRVRHARLLEVLAPSPERTEPDCALHASGACGGCDLLDFSRAAQSAAKAQIVRDALLRIGKLAPAVVDAAVSPLRAPAAGAPATETGRRRARFVWQGGALTFSAKESHARAVVVDCPALHPVLRAALPAITTTLRARALADGAVNIACDDDGAVSVAVGDDDDGGAETPALLRGEVTAGALPFLSDARVFTQATRFGGRAILEEVLAGVGPATSRYGPRHVLELFAGAGHLTGPLVNAGAVVDAVEGAAGSVAFLERNLATLVASSPERRAAELAAAMAKSRVRRAYIDDLLELPARIDVLVADPPRTGIPGFAKLVKRIGARGVFPERIVLVSCDPATGARDIAAAVAQGWTLQKLVPIDAFPRTAHVEWVATLAR